MFIHKNKELKSETAQKLATAACQLSRGDGGDSVSLKIRREMVMERRHEPYRDVIERELQSLKH